MVNTTHHSNRKSKDLWFASLWWSLVCDSPSLGSNYLDQKWATFTRWFNSQDHLSSRVLFMEVYIQIYVILFYLHWENVWSITANFGNFFQPFLFFDICLCGRAYLNCMIQIRLPMNWVKDQLNSISFNAICSIGNLSFKLFRRQGQEK